MKRYLSLFAILLLIGLLCGCSSEAFEEKSDSYAMTEAPYYGASVSIDAESASSSTVSSDRKLIKTVNMSVETEQFDATLSDLHERTEACGGYVELSDMSKRSADSLRSATYTLRIPSQQAKDFTDHLSGSTNVLTRSETQEDITLQYVDTESEITALRVEQERLLELLEVAADLSEILEIETRLTENRYRLEKAEAQLRTYDNQVTYATIHLNIYEVEVYTPTEEKGFWEKLGDGFLSSINGVWQFIKTLFYAFIVALPYLVLLGFVAGVVLAIVFFFLRKRRKKNHRNPQM